MKKLTAIILLISSVSFAQTSEQLHENLQAFSKAYGYVKYFHPSDEAYELDWDAFAIYGAEKVRLCNNDEALITTLNELFNPIAPSAIFYKQDSKVAFDINSIKPEKLSDYKVSFWQHKGLGFKNGNPNSIYKSIRTNSFEIKQKAEATFGNYMTSIDAKPYQGKLIKFEGSAKLTNKLNGTGHLWVRVDTETGIGFFDNMEGRAIRNKQWKTYKIVGKVAADANKIALGAFLNGNGAFAIDNFKLSYKDDNGTWIPIALNNADFEGKTKDWSFMGKGYSAEITSEDSEHDSNFFVISSDDLGATKTVKTSTLFDSKVPFGTLISKPLNKSIACHIPIALYRSKHKGTYPLANNQAFKILQERLNNVNKSTISLDMQYGNIINVWNVFQHFYPYFDVTKVNWDHEFHKAINRCDPNHGNEDFRKCLELFTATLKDGHIWVSGTDQETYFPNMTWEWVEDQLIITSIGEEIKGLKKGTVISKINDEPSKEFFNRVNNHISGATQGWIDYRAKRESLKGREGTVIKLTTNTGQKYKHLKRHSYFTI